MAKALETVLADFTPSPLQQAAIKRIHEYQEELKQYGYYLRSGMELEFMVKDARGAIVPAVIKLDAAEAYLKAPERNLPLLQRFKTDPTAEYEIAVGDHVSDKLKKTDVTAFSPVGVAATTARLKEGELKKMLMESTCLRGPMPVLAPPFTPLFHAYPYSLFGADSLSTYKQKSSALHVNVSLYDKKGSNCFTESKGLMEHCARSLVRVQEEAGLAFLPKNNSLKRLRPESHVSVPGGLGMEIVGDDAVRKVNSSVNIRGGIFEVGGKDAKVRFHHDTRIENRLPGADADPFVAMAVTMAAVVHGVRTYNKSMDKVPTPKFPLTRTHNELVEKFEASQRMETLLGPELYEAILDSYGQKTSVTR